MYVKLCGKNIICIYLTFSKNFIPNTFENNERCKKNHCV